MQCPPRVKFIKLFIRTKRTMLQRDKNKFPTPIIITIPRSLSSAPERNLSPVTLRGPHFMMRLFNFLKTLLIEARDPIHATPCRALSHLTSPPLIKRKVSVVSPSSHFMVLRPLGRGANTATPTSVNRKINLSSRRNLGEII